MKRLVQVALFVVGFCVFAKADEIGDQLKTALLSQVQPITQYNTKGENTVSLLDDVLQIGHYNVDYLGFGQIGPVSTVDSGELRIQGYLIGGSFNWSPIIKSFIRLPEGWTFLTKQFVISSGYHYNTGLHHGSFSYLQLSVIVPLNIR